MSVVEGSQRTSLRTLEAGAGVVLLAEAIAALVVLAAHPGRRVLAITTGFTSSPLGDVESNRVILSHLDVGVAAVVVCLIFAVGRLRVLPARRFDRFAETLRTNRHGVRLVEYGFSSAIVIFVVARLNGIANVSALVPLYAITNGIALFGALGERRAIGSGSARLPLAFAAALGIVPWGVIAFQQVGGIVAGTAPSPLVIVVTLVMLAAAFGFANIQWREQSAVDRHGDTARGDAARGEREYVILGAVALSAFTWLVVAGVSLVPAH